MPQRPIRKSPHELEMYFMENLGYNQSSNYFKDQEVNKEGMIRSLGLNEMAVE